MKTPSYIDLIKKELERTDLPNELRERYLKQIGRFEDKKLSIALQKAKGARLTPARKYTPRAVRDAVIAAHEEKVEAERKEIPLGQRVDQFLAEAQGQAGEKKEPEAVEGAVA